jgi:hypothetical protein
MTLKESIYDYIASTQTISVCEINRRFGSGENNMFLGDPDKNILVGFDMRADVVDALGELSNENRIDMQITVPLIYMIDGGIPTLPVAKQLPKNGYKKLHWLPIVFNTKGFVA